MSAREGRAKWKSARRRKALEIRGSPPIYLLPSGRGPRAFRDQDREMSVLSFSVVDTQKERPYNPPTADEAAPQSADEIGETFEKTKKFESSKGVLTGSDAFSKTPPTAGKAAPNKAPRSPRNSLKSRRNSKFQKVEKRVLTD